MTLAILIAGIVGLSPYRAEAEPLQAPTLARFFTELSASSLFGIDRPIKGCSLDLLVGLGFSPFEVGFRAGGAYESGPATGSLRFDFALGLGSGLRAIVGGLLLFEEPFLADSGGVDARLVARAADWPNRFGIAAKMAETSWRPFGASLGIETEIVYTAYRVDAKTALSGTAAFAAGVEAKVALSLRWEAEK